MSDALSRFRAHDYPIPEKMLAWQLHGAGFEHLGLVGRPELVDVPRPGRMEVLMRVDAVGLCFSDVKLIRAGNEHPRIRGRDLVADPTRPGHEVSLTLAAVGDGVDMDAEIGDRFVIQANIRWKGEDVSFGYVIPGGLSQYVLLDERAIAGDHGNYLIPVSEQVGLVEAALVEPWSCIEGANRIPQRTEMKAGGARVVVTIGGGDAPGGVTDGAGELEVVSSGEIAAYGGAVENLGAAPDDVVIVGRPTGELCGIVLDSLADGGILCLLSCDGVDGRTQVDVGRIHYRDIRIVGSTGADVNAAYTCNARQDTLGGGAALFPGSAGPMGMMHVQRAIEAPRPPRVVVVTDLSAERLAYAERLLKPVGQARGVEYHSVNPGEMDGAEAFDGKLDELSGGRGYDDIVVCAPVGAVITGAAKHCAPGCVVNIFAGVPLGTMSEVDLGEVATKSVKYTGASGSAIEDIVTILDKIAAGKLNTRMSLGTVGGMNQGLEGLEGVSKGRFYGKCVLFPWIEEMPLATPREVAGRVDGLGDLLDGGDIWTTAAEEFFVERMAGRALGT